MENFQCAAYIQVSMIVQNTDRQPDEMLDYVRESGCIFV